MLKIKRIGLIITKEEKRFAIQLARIEKRFRYPFMIHKLIPQVALAYGLGIPGSSFRVTKPERAVSNRVSFNYFRSIHSQQTKGDLP